MEICKESTTLDPLASQFAISPSFWRPEFENALTWATFRPSPPDVADSTTLWGPRGSRRRPGAMKIWKQFITLGPSASKFADSPSRWRPDFEKRNNVSPL